MDTHTLELLEFDKIRELVAGYAACSLGKELAKKLEPMHNVEQIRNEQAAVTEMTEALASGMPPPFGGLSDVRLLIRRAAIGSMLQPDELLAIKGVLECSGNIFRYRMRLDERWQRLIELLEPVQDLGLVAKTIEGCIDNRGNVLDMASRELAGLRRQLKELDEKAQNHLKKMLRDPDLRKILRYPNWTMNGDHYVLPVPVNHRQKVPGVVHRTSSSGETVFIEPSKVAKIGAERVYVKAEEQKEIHRILRRLTTEIARVERPLQKAQEVLAQLDLIFAKARYSRQYQMAEPEMNSEGRLWLRQARHPWLLHLFAKEKQVVSHGDASQEGMASSTSSSPAREVVPIDVRLGQEFKLLVITGPNTGGKTVALKTVGLLSLMAQSGMHIPTEPHSEVPVFHHILADIGDEQSLEQSLSTFSSHISRIAKILQWADDQSLVLLDELGAGTDPTEGAVLGRAILDQLDQIGCQAMVTTHLGDLKTYAFANSNAENAAVEFDIETLRPTYKLILGQYGMSNALKIARRLRLPKDLLNRAYQYLRKKRKKTPEYIKIQKARKQAEKARQEALEAQLEAKKKQEDYEQKLADIQRKTEQAHAMQRFRQQLTPGDRVRVANMDQAGKIVRVDQRRQQAVVKVGLGEWELPLEDIYPEDDG